MEDFLDGHYLWLVHLQGAGEFLVDAGQAAGHGVGGGGADDAGGDETVGAAVGVYYPEAGFLAAAVDAQDPHVSVRQGLHLLFFDAFIK